MAYIKVRKGTDGSPRYTAVIRIRNGKRIIHQEAKTFSLRVPAEKWAKSREVELEDPNSALRQNNKPRTLASLIRWYIETFETVSRLQRSKQRISSSSKNTALRVVPTRRWEAEEGLKRYQTRVLETEQRVLRRLARQHGFTLEPTPGAAASVHG